MATNKINIFFSTLNVALTIAGFQFATSVFSGLLSGNNAGGASLVITIPYHAFALLVSCLAWVYNAKEKTDSPTIIKVLWVFWILLFIRFFYDMYFRNDVTILPGEKIKVMLFMGPMTIIPMVAVMKSYRHIDYDKLLKWTYFFIALSVLLTVFNSTMFVDAEAERAGANEAMGSIGSGHMGLTGLILSIYILLNKKLQFPFKIIVAVIALISTIVFLRSGSRGPVLALLGVCVIFIFGKVRNKKLGILSVLIVAILGYFLLDYIMQALEFISPTLYGRFEQKSGAQFGTRELLYLKAWEGFRSHPLTGSSFGIYEYGAIGYAHNAFLDSLMQLGIGGGLMMLFIYLKPTFDTAQLIREHNSIMWIGLILVQNMMGTMVSGAFYNKPLISVLIVLLYSQCNFKRVTKVNHHFKIVYPQAMSS